MSESTMSRRVFHRRTAGTAAGLTALQVSRVLGANERIRLGVIGVANRGGQLISAFQKHQDADIVALCDVDASALERMHQRLDGKPDTCHDFRTIVERNDIDAVVIATPDHWHAIQTIDACEAGKDVYVEKPISLTVFEGRKMVEATHRTNRVVQVGMQRRSGNLYAEGVKLVQDGTIGTVTVTRSYHRSNMYPDGMGHAAPTAPPASLDWNMWLGPRPSRPYRETIAPYKFRWWKEYCCQISNNGVHSLDLMRWLMNVVGPTAICCMGGKYAVDDDRTIPDTAQTIFEFPEGFLSLFGMYEANGNPTMARGGFVELRGTKGTLYSSDHTIEIVPERGGQFQEKEQRMEPVKRHGKDGNLTVQHTRNFLDCIRSRAAPNASIEDGHRSTSLSLLSKISLAVKKRIEWDPRSEQITNCQEANDMLHYEYRKPWKLG